MWICDHFLGISNLKSRFLVVPPGWGDPGFPVLCSTPGGEYVAENSKQIRPLVPEISRVDAPSQAEPSCTIDVTDRARAVTPATGSGPYDLQRSPCQQQHKQGASLLNRAEVELHVGAAPLADFAWKMRSPGFTGAHRKCIVHFGEVHATTELSSDRNSIQPVRRYDVSSEPRGPEVGQPSKCEKCHFHGNNCQSDFAKDLRYYLSYDLVTLNQIGGTLRN